MPETTEYKDKRGKNRIRHTADNGNVTYGSTQGYENKQDMRDTAVNTSVELLIHYIGGSLSDSTRNELLSLKK